ncbi:PDZ/DHR/GLGF domain protein [Desulforamulus reducens MI-1]|uniref:PDZ/DHR/GLGF domain protein n=1 Tax=Desulforamulus reducens (strain ATCC BAA-1160 / DSM 100696 / MI-1) TaxID=349161 RepID=A4J918_DESRM|nr:PDZ domain-containing protein [Desulforamulus reducens]ABO51571.1 PDZ/DHR/GLGF domain protein [Desulforamulus reducens MI-1]
MFPFTDITPILFQTLGAVFMEPQILELFLLVVAIVALQYYRMGRAKEKFFGLKPRGVWRDVLAATLFGLLGGVLASYIMVFVGLTLSDSGLIYLWPLAILLMFIDARFLCFAYAGGLLALSSIALGWPEVSIPQLLGLVAILHFAEAVLILVSGHLGAMPVFIRNAEGKVVGGFALQKFWPIPLVVMVIVGQTSGAAGGIHMPQWWPLIKGDMGANVDNVIYSLMPVVAGLGYGDLAVARTPKQKGRISAVFLGLYSVILLALAVLTDRYPLVGVAAALFSPLGHEMVIYLGRRLEATNAIYKPVDQGVKILDVIPGYPAWQAGIRSGDIIKEVNGMTVGSRQGLEFALGVYHQVQITYYSMAQKKVYREGIEFKEKDMLGVLPVPEGNEETFMELSTNGPLRRWFNNRIARHRK